MFKRLERKNLGLIIAIVSISLGLIGLVYSSYKTYAANIIAGPLIISYTGSSLFDETNIAPGDTIVKNLSVTNNGTLPHSFSLSASNVSGNLANVIEIEPREGATTYWNETLANLASLSAGSKVIIPSVAPGATRNLQIAAIFPDSAGNQYQNQAVTNFSLTFGDESTDQTENNEFALIPNTSFGSASISNNSSANLSSPTPSVENSNLGSDKNNQATQNENNGSVKAATTTVRELCFWSVVMLAILIFSLIFYYRYNRRSGRLPIWWLWPILLAAVLYLLHYYLQADYEPTIICRWLWLEELIIIAVYYIFEII